MAKGFYYGSILVLWIVFLIAVGKRPFKVRHVFIWITYSLYSLVYEVIFGDILNLYYYITPEDSIIYILLGSLFLYPVKMILYLLFLPSKKVLWYTAGWIVFVQILELISMYTKTVVMTGWKVIPWSQITYLITYLLLFAVDRYYHKVVSDEFIIKRG